MKVGEGEPKQSNLTRAKLEARTYRKILTGGRWITTAELASLANLGKGNPVASLNRWKKDRRLFAIHRDGRDYFPRYALGPDFRPLPAVAQVLNVLLWDGEQLAAWFESTSSSLGGKRPRELIARNPEAVIRAASQAVESEQFAG